MIINLPSRDCRWYSLKCWFEAGYDPNDPNVLNSSIWAVCDIEVERKINKIWANIKKIEEINKFDFEALKHPLLAWNIHKFMPFSLSSSFSSFIQDRSLKNISWIINIIMPKVYESMRGREKQFFIIIFTKKITVNYHLNVKLNDFNSNTFVDFKLLLFSSMLWKCEKFNFIMIFSFIFATLSMWDWSIEENVSTWKKITRNSRVKS